MNLERAGYLFLQTYGRGRWLPLRIKERQWLTNLRARVFESPHCPSRSTGLPSAPRPQSRHRLRGSGRADAGASLQTRFRRMRHNFRNELFSLCRNPLPTSSIIALRCNLPPVVNLLLVERWHHGCSPGELRVTFLEEGVHAVVAVADAGEEHRQRVDQVCLNGMRLGRIPIEHLAHQRDRHP
jgi:hypothetical protein